MDRTRASKVERAARIDTLMGLKAQGFTYSQLVQTGMAHWKISEREVKRYLSEVKKRELEVCQVTAHERLAQIDMRYHYLYC
jgi:DNA-binding TFAR19-related protein (PDSD5 family)